MRAAALVALVAAGGARAHEEWVHRHTGHESSHGHGAKASATSAEASQAVAAAVAAADAAHGRRLPRAAPAVQPAYGPERPLIWADEFDGAALNNDIWALELGNGCPGQCYFGNNELQSYEAGNVYVDNGELVLRAQLEPAPLPNGMLVSSGKVVTTPAYAIRYGRVEVKVTMPAGLGAWSSVFMLPNDNAYGLWPASGEIDILESMNLAEDKSTSILSSLHYGAPNNGGGAKGQNACVFKAGASFAGKPLVMAVDWSPHRIVFSADGFEFCELTTWWTDGVEELGGTTAPFDQPFRLMLNLAIGGDLPAVFTPKGLGPEFAANGLEFRIDYVRYFGLTREEVDWVNPMPGRTLPEPRGYGKVPAHMPDFDTGKRAPLYIGEDSLRIDMEYFDEGGQGVGYYDNNPVTNTGNSALRPYDGVDLYEGDVWIPPGYFKFADLSGAYVKYEQGEWTAYSINLPESYQWWFEIRYSSANGAGFRIIADSYDCADPEGDGGFIVLEVAELPAAPIPPVAPPAATGANNICWYTDRWQGAPLEPGLHKLVFCSLGDDLNVTYMDITSYPPAHVLKDGPGCQEETDRVGPDGQPLYPIGATSTSTTVTDVNGDGIIDAADGLQDNNGDGVIDANDIGAGEMPLMPAVPGMVGDVNGDGVIDAADGLQDVNGDGVIDANDAPMQPVVVPDVAAGVDANGNGVPDDQEGLAPAAGFVDANGNGVPDDQEVAPMAAGGVV